MTRHHDKSWLRVLKSNKLQEEAQRATLRIRLRIAIRKAEEEGRDTTSLREMLEALL